MKNFLKVAIYIILVVVLLNYFSVVYKTNTDSTVSILNVRNIDVYFFGSSGVMRAVSPMKIYEKTGITSYNISTGWMQIPVDYYALKENMKNNKPKVVFIDMESFFDDFLQSKDKLHYAVDEFDMSFNKLELINEKIWRMNAFDRLSFVFPFFRFHDKWSSTTLNSYVINKNTDPCPGKFCYGYYDSNKITPQTRTNYMNEETNENEVAILKKNHSDEYILKIKKLCEKNNIELVLFMPPHLIWSKSKTEKAANWAKENGLRYLDLNLKLKDMKFDMNTDYYDGGHLNISGATKVSSYLGEYLKAEFKLEDHRGEQKYKKWDEDLKRYKDWESKSFEEFEKNLRKL